MSQSAIKPAFPHQKEDGTPYHGMTLRDYFAAKALQPFMQWSLDQPKGRFATAEEAGAHYARSAYRIADAMMAEREK